MDKIQWLPKNEEWQGFVLPWFKIYKSNGHLMLFIMNDRPQSIPIKSVRQGKIKAKKYLDAKIYEKFGE